MPLQKMTKKWWIISLLVVGLAAGVLFADRYYRCHGAPLSRDEAVNRARAQLNFLSHDYDLGKSLPVLKSEQYDARTRSWTITFRSESCEVMVITDRCHGTDIGGLSEGCEQRGDTK
jgi:hypothetical protein